MQFNDRKERRSTANQLIDNMLNERKQLLALLLQTSNLVPGDAERSDNDLLEEFCQVLVDYIAAGHFGLYERISQGKEKRRTVADLANTVYPKIEESTQIALEFSSKYNPERIKTGLNNLQKDLSVLGEALTTRIELEDQLISKMLK